MILQHFPEDPLQLYISNHNLPDEEIVSSLAPATSVCPRLAMLDESTLLELTGHSSLSSIQVTIVVVALLCLVIILLELGSEYL